ncbi:MAG: hypothetical protein A2X94_02610 [Bdellovibrionales bacterium GWB1_55_8]|nr:MAG: hypothetical protein A2X94_02610 [Bdellovibrionales bacterium GWB1_55_8]
MRLYVGNLPFVVEDHQLVALFGENGRKVFSVQIPRDRKSGRSKGFGFVEMGSAGDAREAIDALNGHSFLGRPLVVSEAREENRDAQGGDQGAFQDRSGKKHPPRN